MEVSIAELEAAAALGWRGMEEERLGDWLLRAGGGFTGRANSALANGSPAMPVADAVEAVRTWYAARRLRPVVVIPYPLGGPDRDPVEEFLAGAGWEVRGGGVTVMTATPGEVAGHRGAASVDVRVDPEPDEDWLGMYHYRGASLPPVARTVLMSAPWQAFGSVREDGQVIAIGRVAVARGWAGLTAVEVHPGHRRRNLATVVTAALAAQAAGRGASGMYLQVEDANTAARGLYGKLGFTDHHGYHYRVAPARDSGN